MKIKFNGKTIKIDKPKSIEKIFKKEIEKSKYPVIGSIVNNEYKNLQYIVKKDSEIELIDISSKEGMKMYRRTLVYIAGKAVEELYAPLKLYVNYQLANAMYCNIDKAENTEEMIKKIDKKMHEIVKQDLEIKKVTMNREEATKFYEETGTVKGKLQYDLETNKSIYMYYCGDYYNYCYGTLASRTGIAKLFKLVKYKNGFLIKYPASKNPTVIPRLLKEKKLSWAFGEYKDIHKILKLGTLHRLNTKIKENEINDTIMLAEALHEKKIAEIADKVAKNKNVKMVLIAGPSSSGKTTFAQRLGIQLRLNKIQPVTISVDNYFVEREDNPKDENGEYDFECIEAVDTKLFNDHLLRLLNGEEIEVPTFDFLTGHKKYKGNKLKLEKDQILVIEGIHCLNDKLTEQIPQEQKYKVYASALTVLSIDRYNRISTTDTRLIRRIVRDYQFRGYSAEHTIHSWPIVNKGEEKNIFPFQEEANSVFNTSLIYEISALKPIAEPLLKQIPNTSREYAEAQRLLDILKYFREIPNELIPRNSILKEFTGGGNFKY